MSLHKAASKVRYEVIFNSGSATETNGASELELGGGARAVPAEVARKK
jgi:hypothetical protein